MSSLIQAEDPVNIEKEAEKTLAILNKVINVLPTILNGNLKRSQCPEFYDLTLTYAFYEKLVNYVRSHQYKQTHVLPVILKFLFPDLAQFLPSSIFTLTTFVRRFISKAKQLGQLESVYQPVSKLYSAKHSFEWEDFDKYGITQDMLVTGPLMLSSGCQMQLKNKHVLLLLNLRDKYHLCWVKVVPQWLRFFGILQKDDCVKLQDIKSHWVKLGVQAKHLRCDELQEFLDTPYILPKSFMKKNIESMTSSASLNLSDIDKSKYISADAKEYEKYKKSLQNEVNLLKSHLTSKDKEISAYQKKLKQSQSRLEHLTTRLCKMRLVKNHWLMKYRTMSGINLFAEDFEFNADLTYVQKIRKAARYIKRILQLRYSDKSPQFVENFLDHSFIEEMLEKILVQGISFDKGSNILMEILQELVKHCQRKSIDNLEWQEASCNSDHDSVLINNQFVPYGNQSAVTEEVLVLSDKDSSTSVENNNEQDQCNNDINTSLFHDKTLKKSSDSCSKTNGKHSKRQNVDIKQSQPQENSSGFITHEFPQFLSSKNSISDLCQDEQMLHNGYILYNMITHKRTYDASEENLRDSDHTSYEENTTYLPSAKVPRLERQTPSPNIDPHANPSSYDPSFLPLFLEDKTPSPPFTLKESFIEDISKPFENNQSVLSSSSHQHNEGSHSLSKPKDNHWTLDNKYDSSLRSNCTLEPNLDVPIDVNIITLENMNAFSPPPSPCLILENPDYHQEKPLDSEISLDSNSVELIQDKTVSNSVDANALINVESLSKNLDVLKNTESPLKEINILTNMGSPLKDVDVLTSKESLSQDVDVLKNIGSLLINSKVLTNMESPSKNVSVLRNTDSLLNDVNISTHMESLLKEVDVLTNMRSPSKDVSLLTNKKQMDII